MGPFIFGHRNKIHIINLEKTVPLFQDAMNFLGTLSANGGRILFVAPSGRLVTASRGGAALRHALCHHRWLGGMLTNFKTIRQSIKRLKDLEAMFDDVQSSGSKKEALTLSRERDKLEQSLGGIKNMEGLPDACM